MNPTRPQDEAPVRITPFQPADEAGVLDVILTVQQQEFGIPITAGDQPDLRHIDSFYQTGAGGFWVARADGRVVGTIGLKDIGDGQAALRKMFVAAAYRGPGFGIAAKLLETLLAAAWAKGVTAIFLGTTEKFLAAHRFYEKHGFTRLPREDLPPTFPVMAVDTLFYVWRG
ncbi:GNAT family N-acetyltransferase [Rhodovastum atsumiense]|uniref:GNAT family N-acetyltransferase n=1 Tax=Rhodovastum atsumiense TaxID=504468 RepID=A0A5M6IL48_9PROT|nr:GNAT family N-acetyltransferase [Rhodovastum atsumiense]KAA5608980.1 GNAT family N-acetyltransferase [Rhodovastum atsumiense]